MTLYKSLPNMQTQLYTFGCSTVAGQITISGIFLTALLESFTKLFIIEVQHYHIFRKKYSNTRYKGLTGQETCISLYETKYCL